MFWIFFLFAVFIVPARGDEEKKVEPLAVPAISSIQPFALEAGQKAKITVRGTAISEAKFRLNGCAEPFDVNATVQEEPKADKPSDKKKEKIAETVELEFALPKNTPAGTNVTLIATNSAGESKACGLYVVPFGKALSEVEPNGGFRTAQQITTDTTLIGSIDQANDVDVLKFKGEKGRTLRIEVFAARFNSPLDGSLTIYDIKGAILATNDDAAGRDSLIHFKMERDEDFFVALSCVGEIPAKTTAPYALSAFIEP